jgi:hypothetical protein
MLAAIMAGSGVVVPLGGLKSITIADATPIDPVSSIGASGNGWVAICVLKGLTSLVGTCDATKLVITVIDPGYDADGNVTTVSRTIHGVAHLRRQYPNGDSKMIVTDGTDLAISVTLDDWIYSGTTIVSATLASGFYPSSVAGNAKTKTNNATLAYTKPLFGWINPQLESNLGVNTFDTESVAFHRHATAGRQVACIKYSANDGTTTSPVVTVASTALSAKVTHGNIPEVWKATLDLSTLAAATLCNINAQVYPWLGDASSVLDLSVDGVAWPTSLPQTLLRVLNDRTSAYGGGYAYVNGTGGGTPQVSSDPTTARANPYSTIYAAAVALRAWNNSNRSHNDLGGGFIRLMDAGSPYSVTNFLPNFPGNTWCTIEKDPLAGTVTLAPSIGFSLTAPSLLRYRNLTVTTDGNAPFKCDGTARTMLCLDNLTLNQVGGPTLLESVGTAYFSNIVLNGAFNLSAIPIATSNIASMIGVTSSTGKILDNLGFCAKLFVGCNLPLQRIKSEISATGDGDHGRIIYNNRVYNLLMYKGSANTVNGGIANVQNLYEIYPNYGDVWSENVFSDGDLTTITNYVEMHNTAVGERASRMYNDIVASKVVPIGIQKIGVSKYNIWDNYNIKGDTFSANAAGSVGSMAYMYSVGNVGNVNLFGDVGRAANDAPHNDNVTTPYLGNAWLSSSEYNLFRSALGYTQAQIMAMFGNYTVAPKGSPASGGDYRPVSGATHIKGRVPAGKHVLAYDISGTARNTDGTGAAGAYEAAA